MLSPSKEKNVRDSHDSQTSYLGTPYSVQGVPEQDVYMFIMVLSGA